MAIPVGALIGLGTAIFGGLKARRQRKQAEELERNIVRPEAEVNDNLIENVENAEERARMGLPQEQYLQAQQGINRALTSGFRTAGRGLPGTTSIAGLVRAGTDAQLDLDVADAEARLRAEQNLARDRAVLANEENRVWGWNEQQAYAQQIARVQALRGASQANSAGALGLGANALMNAFSRQSIDVGGIFGGGGSAGTTTPISNNRGNWSSLTGTQLNPVY